MAVHCRLRIFLCVFLSLFVLGPLPGGVRAQDGPPAAAQISPAQKVRDFLAERLGIDIDKLSDETDLVAGLGLDRGDVYLAVADLLIANNVAEPSKQQLEMTEVGAIIRSLTATTRSWTAKAAVDTDFFVQPVYFATDRKATGDKSPESTYGPERAAGGQVSFGRADVNIPKSHVAGQIERPWLESVSLLDPKWHIFVHKVDRLEEQAFFKGAIQSGKDDVLVYIHGFNVSFSDAMLRAAQIAVDFEFQGSVIAFTWPSNRKVASYTADWENALWASRHIGEFLEKVSQSAKTAGRKVHVVAHSMGNKGFLNALRLISYRGVKEPLFQSAILCAPDFDAGMFREQVAAEIRPLASQWVVYASDNDLALITSERITTLRLGKPVTPAEGFEIIDASKVEVTPWSLPETHSYYAVKQQVIDDMKRVLAGLPADKRGLVPKPNPLGKVWTFGE